MFAHIQPPVVVDCPHKGQLTLIAVEGEEVHALKAHEGTTEVSVHWIRVLVAECDVRLSTEQATVLGIAETSA